MWKWVLFFLAVTVIASPIDIWPDLFPLGSLDDVALAVAAMQAFEKARREREAAKKTIIVEGDAQEAPRRNGSRALVRIQV
jgi:uncharacterized membrane protein YkvA (DUF1232 family)